MVPIAHGNDGGGSIRIPAACCGLVGLKAARGRISVGPDSGQSFLVSDGVLTRTVAETAQLLDVLAGYELGDAAWAPPPPAPFAELAARADGCLRVGLALNPPLAGGRLDPDCERAARDAAELLGSLGHTIEEISPPWSREGLLSDFTDAFGPLTSLATWLGGRLAGREPTTEDVEPLTWAMWQRATTHNTISLLASQGKLEGLAREIVVFLAPYDIVVTPALAKRPLAIGEVHGCGPDPWDHYERSAHFTPYTAICNVTGLPAISLPLYQGEDGLPLGVQLIGRPAREDVVLSVAAQLEVALPWAGRVAQL
jgi:amidase